MIYEDSGGDVAALLQVREPKPGQGWYWLDVSRNDNSIPRTDFSPVYFDVGNGRIASSTLRESIPGAKLHAPFISRPSIRLNPPGLEVDLLVCDSGNNGTLTNNRDLFLCNNVTFITYQSWANASHGYFLHASRQYDLAESSSLGFPSTRGFDLAYLETDSNEVSAVWVNGTHAYPIGQDVYDDPKAVPKASFPFARLASINLFGKTCYLYHQINGTTLAEEQYDFQLHLWLTTYITVPILSTNVEDFQ